MLKHYRVFIGIVFACLGCRSADPSLPVIDVKAVKADIVLEWNQLVGNNRLVRLETKPEVLLDDYFEIWVGDKYIITYGNDEMHQFSAEGKHIRLLAKYGRGPGEFQNILGLAVDEKRDRLYFSHTGNHHSLCVINLQDGHFETPLTISWGLPRKMIFVNDSSLFCLPLRMENNDYELYELSISGCLMGGVNKRYTGQQFFNNAYFLSAVGNEVHYMSGLSDTLLKVDKRGCVPISYFKPERAIQQYSPGERGDAVGVLLETESILLYRHIFHKVVSGPEQFFLVYDEDRDPETCILFKQQQQVCRIQGVYVNLLEKKIDDLAIQVSGKFVCQVFKAIEFRELVEKPESPYHEWYSLITDEDNPVVLIGEQVKGCL